MIKRNFIYTDVQYVKLCIFYVYQYIENDGAYLCRCFYIVVLLRCTGQCYSVLYCTDSKRNHLFSVTTRLNAHILHICIYMHVCMYIHLAISLKQSTM
uniref:Uncharacterized protein n=1 Tax=Anguilla anguilla TaxID=7936 RepID=A0A0E9RID0_ANGAN